MFEFSIVRKYLTPRWGQLSVSLISLISIFVIALVVWLIVVFFSVTNGLEKNWISKLTALTAPIRITPTEAYYNSYYYQVDGLSHQADYTLKSLAEKRLADLVDPYDSTMDEEIPLSWLPADREANGNLKNLVGLVFDSQKQLQDIPGITFSDFEMTASSLYLKLLRPSLPSPAIFEKLPTEKLLREKLLRERSLFEQSTLQQNSYLGSFDAQNKAFTQALLPLTAADLSNMLRMLPIASNLQDDQALRFVSTATFQQRLTAFFKFITITQLETLGSSTVEPYWLLPSTLYPNQATFEVVGLYKGEPFEEQLQAIFIPSDSKFDSHRLKNRFISDSFASDEAFNYKPLLLKFEKAQPWLLSKEDPMANPKLAMPSSIKILIAQGTLLDAQVIPSTLETAKGLQDIHFNVHFSLQQQLLAGKISYANLNIRQAKRVENFIETPQPTPLWVHTIKEKNKVTVVLPADTTLGESILLPRPFRDSGILAGDRGFLSYLTPTMSTIQEQRLPIVVAGFYDPGMIPIGGKYLVANPEVVSLIRSAHQQEQVALSNGINVRFDSLEKAQEIKNRLAKIFAQQGIAPYWQIETYREYEFTKDLIQQLQSQKNLFSLLAAIIIIVACSNIISMLIILVKDKKLEIGILRSMGASSFSIALLFGLCGLFIGIFGSLIGIGAALMTLKNLPALIHLLSLLQGHEMFNPLFFGETLPSEVSFETLGLVILFTILGSLLAGLIPAIKATLIRPSAILRAE